MTGPAPSLTWTAEGERFSLHGRIDEHSDFDRLTRELPLGGATLDLSGVRRINSVGTREWMDFLRGIGERPIVMVRCSPAIVEQLNAIANFRGHATVRTVMAVFECDLCGSTKPIELDVSRQFSNGRLDALPAPACDACKVVMSLDDDPSHYFLFVRFFPPR